MLLFVKWLLFFYPKRPEMRYISFKTAKNLVEVNSKYGKGKTVPIENIKKTVNNRKQEIERLNKEIARVNRNQSRLQRAEGYLKNYEKHQAIVEKYENNPFLKGKMLISKSAKQEYDRAVIARNNYQEYMNKEGISDRTKFESQKNILSEIEVKVPEFKEQIQFQEKGLGLLDAVIKGIEIAGKEMNRQQKLKSMKVKRKERIIVKTIQSWKDKKCRSRLNYSYIIKKTLSAVTPRGRGIYKG
ncbi:hypothetical protein COD11_09460 [Bacillus sp. AFS040349]|nr:hypothetical protein COD11_09460 [Bacillus sp. AFS040349]